MTSKIDAVLIDAAGTLIEPAEPVADTYARFARRFGADIAPGRLMSAFRHCFDEMPPMAFKDFSPETLDTLERDWWRSLVAKVIARSGGDVEDFAGFFSSLYAHYATGAAWTLFPEVATVIDELVARDYKIAVVSNFDSRLIRILQAHELESLFGEIVHSTGVGAAKPDTGIFEHALAKLGVSPARAVHVGDSHLADYLGAKNAGLEGLLLQRPSKGVSEPQEHVIENLTELLSWLDAHG